MTIAQMLVPEFDHEMTTTRSLLERVPEGAAEWKPHAKSMAMGHLASHIAAMPSWVDQIMTQPELDFLTPAGAALATPAFESTGALVAMFDRNVGAARARIASATDEDMGVSWTLRAGARQIVSMPRAAVVRSFIMSHMIHHRGQLSVYLRLRDVPLPPIYGPTADS